ncbi:MAG: galactokinase [Bacteroidetes bacterium]|nr:galactokinase [Bacteroidota bacterium]MBU1116530.1 galactokinase [Bacteroidota bacterium]MBU1796849.1 galactokinase [Bacteroidota bacterium]
MEKIKLDDFKNNISFLYGEDSAVIEYQKDRYNKLLENYYSYFPQNEKVSIISTPGRTEISGNHTDHNGGKVIAASINLDILTCISRNENIVILKSDKYDEKFVVNLTDLNPNLKEEGTTNSLIRGIAAGFVKHGYAIGGFKGVLTSDVLQGSGLSSSASIEIAIGAIFNFLYNNNEIEPHIIAKIGQFAENEYFGKPCGLMDQLACAVGGVVAIDFNNTQNPIIKKVKFSLSDYDYKLLVVDTGGTHQNLTEDYASIPNEMKQVAKYFGKEKCSEIDFQLLLDNWNELRKKISDRAVLRAFHFFKENERVDLQVKALQEKNLNKFLKLVKVSGDSSFKYVQNIYSTKDVNTQPMSLAYALTEDYIDDIGEGAYKVHGGGFAGTIVVFLPKKYTEDYIIKMEKVFGKNSVSQLDIRPYGSFVIYE